MQSGIPHQRTSSPGWGGERACQPFGFLASPRLVSMEAGRSLISPPSTASTSHLSRAPLKKSSFSPCPGTPSCCRAFRRMFSCPAPYSRALVDSRRAMRQLGLQVPARSLHKSGLPFLWLCFLTKLPPVHLRLRPTLPNAENFRFIPPKFARSR